MRFGQRSDSDGSPDRLAHDGGSPEQRERRQQILDSVRTLASDGGFDAVQMASVAEHANISLATLYRYYPSKIHLLVTALNRALEFGPENAGRVSISGETAYERLLAKSRAITRQLRTAPQLAEAMTRALMFADATVVTEAARTGGLVERMFAGALSPDQSPSAEDLAVARVISDIWLANLVAWVSRRVSAEDVERRMDAAAGVLFGRPVEHAAGVAS